MTPYEGKKERKKERNKQTNKEIGCRGFEREGGVIARRLEGNAVLFFYFIVLCLFWIESEKKRIHL